MKKLITLIGIFILTMQAHGQSNQLECAINESLTSSIKKRLEYLERKTIKPKFFIDLHISIDNFPPYYPFKDSIADIPVNYISLVNYSGHKKQLKKGIWILSLSNLSLDNNKLTIVFALTEVTLKKKRLYIAISESDSYIYEYSCDKQKWIFVSKKYFGI